MLVKQPTLVAQTPTANQCGWERHTSRLRLSRKRKIRRGWQFIALGHESPCSYSITLLARHGKSQLIACQNRVNRPKLSSIGDRARCKVCQVVKDQVQKRLGQRCVH